MKISVYINYFNPAHIIKTDILVPIQTGRAISQHHLPMMGDDVGDNISEKNRSYCELTGQYWVWKNDRVSAYLGFMHYRRVFDFHPELTNRQTDAYGLVVEERFTDAILDRYGLNDTSIRECVAGYDMILPEPWSVTTTGSKSIYDQYKDAPFHHIRDLEKAGECINELFPEYYQDFLKVMSSTSGFFTNMFVFKREIFEEYSQWLFRILDSLEKSIDSTKYSATEFRFIGYIAERLMSVFVTHKLRTTPSLRIRYLRRVFVRDPKPHAFCPDVPTATLPIVSVVAATDRNYAAHTAALVASVLSNASRDKFIDFIILDGGITEDDRRGFRMLERLHQNAKISFIDMSMQFLDIETHMHFTRPTFYRLALPEIVQNRKKILFVDADAVVLDDVGKVFDIDLEGKAIAAARDLIMAAFVAKGVPSMSTAGGMPSQKYLSDYLGLGEFHSNYFQAGVILFDLDRLRQMALSEKMISELRRRTYWFLDQDVLNKYLAHDVKYIEPKWNCVNIPEDVEGALPEALSSIYQHSKENPSVIHFAGAKKPWDNFDSFFAHYYWYYLRMTPWYERVLTGMTFSAGEKTRSLDWRRIASGIWRRMPQFMRKALWPLALRLARMK